MDYKVHFCGTVSDGTQDGFKMGFDITVENGGTVQDVADQIQATIDALAPRPVSVDKDIDFNEE